MRSRRRALAEAIRSAALALATLALAGCTGASAVPTWTAEPAGPELGPAVGVRMIEVYRSPTCTCCHEWEAYLRAHGWTVRSIETDDMTRVKQQHQLPETAWSCHTAVIDGYVVEGHLPLAAIEDLLADRPAIDGIALPGMPAGSPGMPGIKEGPFQILAVEDGSATLFGAY
jgi:hypothetical protein